MHLPARSIPDLDELEAMRPKKGDVVAYGEDLFTVDEVGMKYVVCHSPDTPHMRHWFKHHEVIKWIPPDDQMTRDLHREFNHIGPA